MGRGALYRMARELAESVIERHRQRRQGRARRITIDLDPTDDPTHGAQQLTFFNGFYDTWCYLPLLTFVAFGREADQYLCATVLRSGKAVASEGAVALLSRLLPLLRCAFPRARFLVRLDAGFATPEVFDFLDACPRLDYVISIPKNAVLVRHAEPAMTRARSARSGRTEHVYGETRYAAGSWKQQRRVVIKAEVVRLAGREPRDNPRFVVTNLCRPPRSLYEKVYCARGDIENRIKELLDGLQPAPERLTLRRAGPCRPPHGFRSAGVPTSDQYAATAASRSTSPVDAAPSATWIAARSTRSPATRCASTNAARPSRRARAPSYGWPTADATTRPAAARAFTSAAHADGSEGQPPAPVEGAPNRSRRTPPGSRRSPHPASSRQPHLHERILDAQADVGQWPARPLADVAASAAFASANVSRRPGSPIALAGGRMLIAMMSLLAPLRRSPPARRERPPRTGGPAESTRRSARRTRRDAVSRPRWRPPCS